MIVRNESGTLPTCLQSVRELADEMIVVDTGSIDGTQAIAREHGARVFEMEWPNDFSRARNAALERARGAWILVLDADESLPPASCDEIRKLIEGEPTEAFRVVTKNTNVNGQHVRGTILRLFPNRPDVRYQFPIHEEVNLSLARAGVPIRETNIEVLHSGYADPETLARKAVRNRTIIAAALANPTSREEELHLRYYYAGSFYDSQDWARAVEEYAVCEQRSSSPDTKLARIARLRVAECQFLIGDLEAARRYLPAAPEADAHPAALCLGGQIASQRGAVAEARGWFETVLGVPDVAFLPPVPLGTLKFKALNFLGSYWAGQGRKDIGARVLRLALEIKNRARDGASPEIGALYEQIVRMARVT